MQKLQRFMPQYLSLLILISTLPLSAQEKNNSISINIGNHINKSQDLVFSEQIYSGSSLISFGVGYERTSARGGFRVDFSFDRIKTSPSERVSSQAFGTRDRSTANQLSLQCAYERKLSGGEVLTWYLGGILKARYYEANLAFGLGEEDSYFYENSINPNLSAIYQLNAKNRLQVNLYLPLVSFIARPDFAIVDNREIQGQGGIGYLYKKGELAFWGDYRAINWALSFSRSFSHSVDGFFRYNVEYWRSQKPDALSVLKNNFDIGLSFRF